MGKRGGISKYLEKSCFPLGFDKTTTIENYQKNNKTALDCPTHVNRGLSDKLDQDALLGPHD